MKHKDVNFVDEVPKWPEFSAKQLWNKAKNNPQFLRYFADFQGCRAP